MNCVANVHEITEWMSARMCISSCRNLVLEPRNTHGHFWDWRTAFLRVSFHYPLMFWRHNDSDVVDDIQGVVVLSIALAEEPEDHIQAASAWSLGQIGRHTPEHSKAVAQANVFPRLLQCYTRTGASEDLQTKVTTPPTVACCPTVFVFVFVCCVQFMSKIVNNKRHNLQSQTRFHFSSICLHLVMHRTILITENVTQYKMFSAMISYFLPHASLSSCVRMSFPLSNIV